MPRIMKRHAAAEQAAHEPFNFEDVVQRCEEYKTQVRDECRQLVLKANEDAAEIRERAQVEGQSEGYRNGLRQAEQEIEKQTQELADQLVEQRLSTVLPSVSGLLDELVSARSRCQAEWERELVELSVGIAEKLIRHRFEVDPAAVVGVVQEAVQLAVGKSSLELRLNPEDLNALGDRVRGIVQQSARGIDVQLLGDDNVTRGGCRVVTEHGEIDAQLESMLQRITDELLEGIREPEA